MRKDLKALILKTIKANGRIMSDDEAFDFYAEHIMKSPHGCKISPFAKYDNEKGFFREGKVDLKLWEIVNRARFWHSYALGSLVKSGDIKIVCKE